MNWLLIVCLVVTMGAQAQTRPALIPLPQSLQWTSGDFLLRSCHSIVVKEAALQKEAMLLQQIVHDAGVKPTITHSLPKQNYIEIKLGAVRTPLQQNEAYRLQVTSSHIQITANTAHGVFNALQTLRQLIVNHDRIPGCTITDYPSYSWRGYMVDAARNYQSLPLLKQQIGIMSKYKLNVFHFHVTEDVAWRLQIKQYPQLTAEKNMTRNKGKFYSVDDMKELIQYCRDRYITLVPEIDMPGHSAAFTRSMGANMQSAEGLQIVKNILQEICTTYDAPYIHIGADEVAIKNKAFLPEVTALIASHKKQVIAWSPGGNYDNHVIRQLWKDEGMKDVHDTVTRYIDSRSLYISDMDPLNCVVSLYHRQIGQQAKGNNRLLGAEFCLWSDRRVSTEEDLLRTNPVFPAMLAFAERSWCGGGYTPVTFAIGPDTSNRAQAFVEFEQRLLVHKKRNFMHLPFQYVQQTGMHWKLFGPFNNQGDLLATFWPEQSIALDDSAASMHATGGTIWLWHTNGPAVQAWLPSFNPQTTWYAYTSFYCAQDTVAQFWIDGKDVSRSGADATAPEHEWDYTKTRFWLNDSLIAPPVWIFPGRPKGLLEEPLVDEGFYYRPPLSLPVKKGWNRVLVKLPIDQFDHSDWQVPPKWMFTFIPVRKDNDGQYSFDSSMQFR